MRDQADSYQSDCIARTQQSLATWLLRPGVSFRKHMHSRLGALAQETLRIRDQYSLGELPAEMSLTAISQNSQRHIQQQQREQQERARQNEISERTVRKVCSLVLVGLDDCCVLF
jgi:chromosome condensin MukBEF complex kleisin-like MukF subunit